MKWPIFYKGQGQDEIFCGNQDSKTLILFFVLYTSQNSLPFKS